MLKDDSIRRYLRHPRPETFDRLASELLLSQASDRGGDAAPSVGRRDTHEPSWRTANPARRDDLPSGHESPADDPTLHEVVRAHWSALSRPTAAPLLLLLSARTALERRLRSVILEAEEGADILEGTRDGRLDSLRVRSWLGARQRGARPALIVTTNALCERLILDLQRKRLRFRLPVGSGLYRLCSLEELRDGEAPRPADVTSAIGVPPERQAFLVEVPSLASMIEVRMDSAGAFRLASPAPWIRYRLLDDATADPRPGAARLAIFDLATTRLPALQDIEWPAEQLDDCIRLLRSD
jgi:hypothetical protein